MERMKIMLDPGAYAPARAHALDAGLDLRAMKGGEVPPGRGVVFRTGVHVQLPAGTCGLLVSKSGLNVRAGVTSTGLIDEGYTGEILVRLDNHGTLPYIVSDGDKISQLVVIPILRPQVEIADTLDGDTERGDKGFGSSGK